METQKFKHIQTKKVESFNSPPGDKQRSTKLDFSFEMKKVSTDNIITSQIEELSPAIGSVDFL